MKQLLQDVWDAFRSPMIVFTLMVGLLLVLVLSWLDMMIMPDYKEILIEAHGLVFDLFLFGILLAVYDLVLRRRGELRREKNRIEDLITRYKEEIDDYRGWKSEEAMFRTIGNLKRLNGLGMSELDLCNTYLSKGKLRGINLRGAHMRECHLVEVDLREAILENTDLHKAFLNSSQLNEALLNHSQMTKTTLVSARLQKASLYQANLEEARLANADLSDANLSESNCKSADFSYANLQGANLQGANLSGADLGNADLRGAQLEDIRWKEADLGEAIIDQKYQEMLAKEEIKDFDQVQFV